MKKRWLILIGIILIVGVIGGKIYMDSKSLQTDMVEIVEQNEPLVEEKIKEFDTFRKIDSISIDYKTIEKSPMGGVLFQGFINGDRELSFNSGLIKNNEKIEITNTSPKKKLYNYLMEED